MGPPTREWTVGELARDAGITVRTLHHYDRIGLLVPSDRSTGGHRRYAVTDVERLYRIVALRSLGFGLDDIAAVLDSDNDELLATARRQLRHAAEELEHWTDLRARLVGLIETLERSGEPSPDDLLETMEATAMTIRLDRIYTGIGDRGETELADGTTVAKTDAALDDADLEELSAHIGVALALEGLSQTWRGWLERVQSDLLDLGVGPRGTEGGNRRTDATYVDWLSQACEEANRDLGPLDSFVLPGGGALAAQLHVCRTVCRRLERWSWGAGNGIDPELPRYLNRLSDLLFILSRATTKGEERLWRRRPTG